MESEMYRALLVDRNTGEVLTVSPDTFETPLGCMQWGARKKPPMNVVVAFVGFSFHWLMR